MNIYNERLLFTATVLIILVLIGAAIRQTRTDSQGLLSIKNIKARFVLAAVAFAPLSYVSSLAFCFLVGIRWLLAFPIALAMWGFVVAVSWSRRRYWNNG